MSTPEADDPTALYRELRLALVINGGVSLAIWMGGAVKEIDRFRCAHRRRDPDAADAPLYRTLLEALRTEVVTDVLAGTSAGGINSTLLAYGVANGRSLEAAGPNAIRDLWVGMGALDRLRYERHPRSALQGEEVLYAECVGMFRALQAAAPDLDPLADRRVRLSVTASDTSGFPLRVAGASTRDHRVLMRFRRTAPPVPTDLLVSPELRELAETYVGRPAGALQWPFPERRPTRDLTHPDAPLFLARAARSTSAFPLAFAPSVLPFGSPGDAVDGRHDLATPPMDEIVDSPASGSPAPPADDDGRVRRFVIDGGVWDNSPFGAVLDGIDRSPSSREVRRLLTYVVGVRDVDVAETAPRVPGLIGGFAQAFGMPSDLSFTADLERIRVDLDEQRVEQANLPRLLVGRRIDVLAAARMLYPIYRDRVRTQALAEARARIVAGGPPVDPAHVVVPTAPQMAALPEADGAPLAAWGAEPGDWQWGIGPVRRTLQDARDALRAVLRALTGGGYETPAEAIALARDVARARKHLAQLVWLLDDLAATLDERTPADPETLQEALHGAWNSAARAVCGGAMAEFARVVHDLAEKLDAYAEAHGGAAAQPPALRLAHELGAGSERAIVRRALAIEVAVRAFVGAADDHRPRYNFSSIRPGSTWPLPAPAGTDVERPQLAGAAFHHFGAFLRGSWRAHDWMWGRLDGASQVIDLLVDAEQLQRLGGRSGADAEALAGSLATVAIPDGRDADAYARTRRVAEQALAARGLPVDGPDGPAGDRARGPRVDARAVVVEWRNALVGPLAHDVALAQAGDVDALERIRDDVKRPFAHLIAEQEVPFVHAQSCSDHGRLPDVARLLDAEDRGLRAIAPEHLCEGPSEHELRRELALAIGNVSTAEHKGVVSDVVGHAAKAMAGWEGLVDRFD